LKFFDLKSKRNWKKLRGKAVFDYKFSTGNIRSVKLIPLKNNLVEYLA
jgi:hypothetical protein